MSFGVIFTHLPCLDPQESSWLEKKYFFRKWHQNSPTYGHVTKLFLELEFQHKGNKQTKKGLLATNSCSFLGRNGFRKYKLFKCNTEKDKNKNWTDLSLLGQEPTFKSDHRFKFVEGFYLLLHSEGLLRNTYQLSLLKVFFYLYFAAFWRPV